VTEFELDLKPQKRLSSLDVEQLLHDAESTASGTIQASNRIIDSARKKLNFE